ncbi:hypothetical protein HQ563_18650 [bacterium]|nr:hypothetical protein [bacterium]
MKKVIAVTVVVVFAALLCQVAFSQPTEERPRRRPRAGVERPRPEPLTEEQRAELRKAMERLREINQNEALREIISSARQAESVQKANEAVRKAQEAARNAQEAASKALDAAALKIATEKKDEGLLKLLKERGDLLQKLQQSRGRFPGGMMRRPGGRGTGTGRPRPAE